MPDQNCQIDDQSRLWNRWAEKARAAGLPEHIVDLGRSLIRRAVQRTWSLTVQRECGCLDGGEEMLKLALTNPPQAAERWLHWKLTAAEVSVWRPRNELTTDGG